LYIAAFDGKESNKKKSRMNEKFKRGYCIDLSLIEQLLLQREREKKKKDREAQKNKQIH